MASARRVLAPQGAPPVWQMEYVILKSSRTSRAAKGTLTSVLQFGLQSGLQLLLSPVILRVAGQETLGAYAILMQVISYLALTDLGFGVAVSRYSAQATAYDDQGARFGSVIITGKTFSLGANIVFAVLAFALIFRVGDLFILGDALKREAQLGLGLLAVWAIVRTPLGAYPAALIATQHLAATNLINLLGGIVRLISSLGLVLAGAGLVGLILSNIVTEAMILFVQRWYYRRIYSNVRWGWGIPDRRLLREMTGFGLQYLLVSVASRLVFSTDNLVVGGQYGPTAAAAYYSTQMPTFLIVSLVWKISDNSAPAANELFARHAYERLQSVFLRLLRYSLLLAFGLLLGLLAFNQRAITAWVGAGQYAGDAMTVALALFAIATIINHVNALMIVVYGTVRWLSIVGIVGGLTNLALSIALGLAIGPAGVMIASAIIELLVVVFLGRHVLQLMQLPKRRIWREVLVPTLAANCCTLPVLGAMSLVSPPFTWSALILWALLFGLAWSAGVTIFGLSREEFNQLHEYFMRRLAFNK
jgi:O-antigen/teichoic acid export membrane protein